MLKIISCNLNGIRSAERKGFFRWVKEQNPDILCVQETKAQLSNLDLTPFSLPDYRIFFSDAEKKGYSGVAVYSKLQPREVNRTLDFHYIDTEGRFIELVYPGLRVVSLYLPSGTSGQERQDIKMDLLDHFYQEYLLSVRDEGDEVVICGDWNIAHQAIDLRNWKQNQKNSGFLPEERAWMDKVFALGWRDAFRVLNQDPDQYTWWTYRGQARVKNVGWRIDYQVVTPGIAETLKKVSIYKDEVFSDHAPLIMEYQHVFA